MSQPAEIFFLQKRFNTTLHNLQLADDLPKMRCPAALMQPLLRPYSRRIITCNLFQLHSRKFWGWGFGSRTPPQHHVPGQAAPELLVAAPLPDATEDTAEGLPTTPSSPKVLVLWDLDNLSAGKIPTSTVVNNLRHIASGYGSDVEIHAFGNRHALIQAHTIRPSKRQEEVVEPVVAGDDLGELPEEELDSLWGYGDGPDFLDRVMEDPSHSKPQELRCHICGQKQKTEKKLANHIKNLHERERRKKLNHIASTKSQKRKDQLWERHEKYLTKFAVASSRMSDPELNGLEEDLKQAGVTFHQAVDAPDAADGALRRKLKSAVQDRVGCVLLASGDKGFAPALEKAQQHIKTVVVARKVAKKAGKTCPLHKLAGSGVGFVAWAKVLEGPLAGGNSKKAKGKKAKGKKAQKKAPVKKAST